MLSCKRRNTVKGRSVAIDVVIVVVIIVVGGGGGGLLVADGRGCKSRGSVIVGGGIIAIEKGGKKIVGRHSGDLWRLGLKLLMLIFMRLFGEMLSRAVPGFLR